ncbi:zinc-finger of the MIZ type in Nse subunit-domain-containing protein [Phlyctochytrium arcticum]|nr:zinc-finger of the MIZ type in Nse subunit-domain-containing protein [Phlyctochytrium arcticum]
MNLAIPEFGLGSANTLCETPTLNNSQFTQIANMAALAAYGSKFKSLIDNFEPVLNNAANGVDIVSDAAAELQDSIEYFKKIPADQLQAATAPQRGGRGRAAEVDYTTEHAEQIMANLSESLKQFLDVQAEFEATRQILKQMNSELSVNHATVEDNQLVNAFNEKYEAFQQLYATKTDEEKYHGSEDYVEYQRRLWEKTHPGKPFTLNASNEEEDDELEIVSQNESMICPITRSYLDDPVTSQVCRHSYSSEAITAHIKISQRNNHNSRAECPVAGCNKYVQLSDLRVNKSLARIVAQRKAQEEAESAENEADYEEIDEE